MTYREAKEVLVRAKIQFGRSNGKTIFVKAIIKAIQGIEKQLKKMPIDVKTTMGDNVLCCPDCKRPIVNVWSKADYKPHHCHFCGQALNWEESDCETKDEGNKDFVFDYGIVEYQHRFSITRSLDDYEVTTLNKCIRMGIQYKYYTMACDKLIAEMQITYKDENNKLHCFTADLHDFTFSIKHKGDMRIDL